MKWVGHLGIGKVCLSTNTGWGLLVGTSILSPRRVLGMWRVIAACVDKFKDGIRYKACRDNQIKFGSNLWCDNSTLASHLFIDYLSRHQSSFHTLSAMIRLFEIFSFGVTFFTRKPMTLLSSSKSFVPTEFIPLTRIA